MRDDTGEAGTNIETGADANEPRTRAALRPWRTPYVIKSALVPDTEATVNVPDDGPHEVS